MPDRESIEFSIYMNAVDALRGVDALTKNAKSMQKVWDELTIAAKTFSSQTGLSLTRVGDIFSGIIRQGEQLRTTLNSAGVSINRLPNDLRKVAGIDLFGGKGIAAGAIGKETEAGIGINTGIKQLRENLREAERGMEQVNKEAAQIGKNLSNAAAQAQLLAVYSKQGFQNLSFAPIQKQDATIAQNQLATIAQYKANVQSLMTGIKNASKETGKSLQDVGNYISQNFQNIPKVALTDAMKGLNAELKGVDDNAKKTVRSLDAIRIALGAIVAMIVFRVIEAFGQFFSGSIKAARNLELSLYNIVNAERLLSEQGIKISPKDLQDITTEVQKLVPIFSRVDVTNAVAGIALFTKDLKLSKEQIEDLSKSIAVLAVRNRAFGLTFEQVRSQVLTGLLTGRAQGIRDLGVSVSETTIQAEALRLGLVKTKEEFDGLSGEMEANVKAQALVSVITRSTAGEMDTLNQYMKTSDARIESNKAAWEDFMAAVGRGIVNIIPDISKQLEFLQKGIEVGGISKLFKQAIPAQEQFAIKNQIIFARLAWGIKLSQKEYDRLKETLKSLSPEDILRVFPDPSAIKDRFSRELIQSLVTQADTATASIEKLGGAFTDLGAAMKGAKLDDFLKDLKNLQEKAEELQREFQEKMQRMAEDFSIDQRRAAEDYQRNVAQTIQDFNDKRHDAEQKYRLQEQEAEARFQENMRQLREKFLFNLEDAMRERDARQVLRLIREYQMEKQNMTNEEQLRKESAAAQHAEEMARLKREEAERLAQLAEEYAVKQQRALEDYNLKKQREAEEHAQDMADLKAQIAERMQEFAKALADELGLKADGAQKIYAILEQYYGKGGLFDALYAYSIGSMTANAQALLDAISNIAGQAQTVLSGMAQGMPFPGSAQFPSQATSTFHYSGRAKGGTFYADRPTTTTFGDAGPEIAHFIPIKDATKPMSLAGALGGGGMGGNMALQIMLSEGLVAQIIDQSLENVSVVIEEVQRNR